MSEQADESAGTAADPVGADRTPAGEFPDDPEQPSDTDPEDVYRNMRNLLRVTERGTLARDADPDGGEG